jgi:hypothetical protein
MAIRLAKCKAAASIPTPDDSRMIAPPRFIFAGKTMYGGL